MHQLTTVLLGTHVQLYREAFTARMLQCNNYQVVDCTNNYQHLIHMANLHQPQVIITSLHAPGCTMAHACLQLTQTETPPAVIILSPEMRRLQFEECVKAGANGFLDRDDDTDCIVTAIETVLAGRMYHSKDQGEIIRSMTNGTALLDITTPKERQIMCYWAQGLSCKEIAIKMQLKVATVENYRKNLMNKLNLKPQEVVAFALYNGIASFDKRGVATAANAL